VGVPSVLIVEDDGVIARSLATHLRHAGFDVEWAEDGERGLRKMRFERPDVCVVDLMLPGLDGWAVTERARDEGITTPIIVISARASEHDKVHALEIGADDYLAKPFGMRELVARVQAAVRRSRIKPLSPRDEPIDVPGLVIDPDQQRAFLVGEGERRDAELTPTEFRLLWVLAQNNGRAMSRDELQQRVWNVAYRHRDRSVDVCVRKVREKVDRRATHTYLQTHYGIGYRFAPTAKTEA
jgi:DNA-binding response OmpR family regulator